MLWEVLIIGSFWWWILAVVWFCFLIFLIEEERGTFGTFVVLLGLTAVQLFSDFNLVGWIWKNPLWIGVGAVGYVVIGSIWATVKWTFFAKDQREKYEEEKERWLQPENLRDHASTLRSRSRAGEIEQSKAEQLKRWADALETAAANGGGELTNALKPAWTNYRVVGARYWNNPKVDEDYIPTEVPHPKNHKASIMRWGGHWPWSMFWALLNDPIRWVGKQIYKRMSILLVAIGQREFAGVEDDFMIEEDDSGQLPEAE